MSAAEEAPTSRRKVGIYHLEEQIGSGAMGRVYRATHDVLGKEVALKILHADDPDGELHERFLQEGVAASRIRHPNVVEILDAGKDGDVVFTAMQLLEGETLANCLERQGRLPLTYAIDLFLPICAGLSAAHSAGVLHRDLKPENIFLHDVGRGEPEPILLDFGISKILGPVDAGLTQNPRFLGTPLYIAPEQADGAPGSPVSDQYSLALTLYETLLGVRPFAKFKNSLIQLLRHVAEGDIPAPRQLDASISEELEEIILQALSCDPKARFESVQEFGAALLPFASAARRTIWQHSFVDTERTLTSINAPVSASRSSRKVHVSVERGPVYSSKQERLDTTRDEPTSVEHAGRGDFLSHSLLFKEIDSRIETGHGTFEPGQSSVGPSRRARADSAAATDHGRSDDSTAIDSVRTTKQDELSTEPLAPRRTTFLAGPFGLKVGTPEPPLSIHHTSAALASTQDPSSSLLSDISQTPGLPRAPGRAGWVLFSAATLGLGALGIYFFSLLGEAHPTQNQRQDAIAEAATAPLPSAPPTPSSSIGVSISVDPPGAQIELDGKFMGTGMLETTLLIDGASHQLRFSHHGYEPASVVFQNSPPPQEIRLKPLEVQSVPSDKKAPKSISSAPHTPKPSRTRSLPKRSVSPQVASTKSAPSKVSKEKLNPERKSQSVAPQPAQGSPKQAPIVLPTGNLNPWPQ